MLKSPLLWKMITLGGAMILLLIPLMMVRHTIVERADYRSHVEAAIRQSTSGPQKVVGPLVAVPVTELYTVLEEEKEVQYKRSYLYFWLPESLLVEGNQNVEARKIGIYQGQVWHTDMAIKAEFDVARLHELNRPNITLGKPFIVVGVGDARGISAVKAPQVNGETLTVEPGTGLPESREGIHIPLPDSQWATRNLTLDMSLNLSGTGSFSLVPVGRSSEMTLSSNWPHPNFVGDFLPGKREISGSGFQAQWQTSRFATNLGEQFADAQKVDWDNLPAFSVAVSTPADQYQLTDRATKYAILLITLTFMAFFVFETLTGQRLHPMQYLLVGLSLVMFYLLLLALSEHIGFTPAWIAASLVGALMNSVYLQAVLKGWRNSVLFTLALLALDGVMWGLLRSEDSSLLLGTGVLLLALGGVMFLTRHLDWYSLFCQQRKSLPPVKDDELRLWK
ncbi:cell envelope integrity protein CreD [Salmonella enterica subsp. enterica serovar Kentucky]|uniref:cell envelope integrity protein CreD n=1 Tax=Salmonella enterica TaxID=28901 RepID=UPI0009A974FD|nr:cell envelope integrity protein CreD [Salmonella enterica]EAA9338322.1 cell envelope integrity protein CreD [Salmonella enterica subsp. enterica serovar Kentucky]EAT9891190.1 cell envelope integrity protein CreD [Salmonella enterica]ECW6496770.1 cell envelope integrity protein CreD [Salmonella enterica subsp. enterica serovar Kentucky]EGH0548622.1 cell envelope integrity protein CreD [Salmonella enterica subsp. enterica serovar Kentucky]PVP03492.1 cell envelope integrity protein CreD [Salmo